MDLRANLRHFREKYDDILAKHDERRDSLASVRGTPYRRVQRIYVRYIKAQRDEVQAMLDRLGPSEASLPGAGTN